ncbi:MAG: transporter substrate-binding domain-containing protein, partial [Schwartzia sp.]|nr:transporter substrate-binding domain-containing protein [Schwartzia sp. (in: firmicutes)]
MPRWFRVLTIGLLTLLAQASLCCAELQTLRVGYFNSPIYLTKDKAGDYTGAIYENLETAMAYVGYRPEYVPLAPEEANAALQAGLVDVLAGIVSRAPRNSEAFDMVDRVIASTPVYLAHPYNSAPPTGRLRVGYYVPVYGALVDFYRSKPEETDLASFEMIPYDDMEQFYLDFRRGAVDACLTSDFRPDDTIPIERTLFPANIYLAVRPGDDELRETIEAGIEKALAVDPAFRERNAVDVVSSILVLSREEREFLRSRRVIRVASSGHQPPLTYFEGDDVKGIIRDIYDRFEKDLDLRVEIVQAKNNAEVMELLAAGKIDLAAHINANHNRANAMNARLTMPYLEFSYLPVMRRYEALPEHPRVACPRKHFFIQNYVRRHYPEESILWCDNFSECYDAVNEGRADVLFAKSISVFQELDSEKYYNLQTTGQIAARTRMAMAVGANADPMLLAIVNKEIAHIGTRGVNEIVRRYMVDAYTVKSWKAYIYENPLPAVGAALAVAFAVAGAAIYTLRVRKESTKELFKAAYVNPFTGIHTMRWFERFVPGLIEKRHKKERAEGRLCLMSLQTHRFDLLKATYDQRVLFAGIAKLIKDVRKKNGWLLYDSISSELSQMYILFRREGSMTPYEAVDKMMEDAAEIKGENISIHMSYRVGLCDIPPDGPLDLPQLMTNAAVARSEADAHGEAVGLYDEKLQK